MTKGFLIHAYNNQEIDYSLMALCCALLIKKHLKINSTSLVTNSDTYKWLEKTQDNSLIKAAFDNVIFTDIDTNVGHRTFFDTRYSKKKQPYYNTNRSSSYDLSPYEQTILLDADYLVLDTTFDLMWDSVEDIMVNKKIKDLISSWNYDIHNSRLNQMSVPLYWATVIYFKKGERTKAIFDLVMFIKENYEYYKHLYKLPPSNYFRNDFALSIALHMISGHFENDSIKSLPNSIMQIATENDDLIDFKNGAALFLSEKEQGSFKLHEIMTNVHVMNKWSINRVSKRIIDYACN